MFYLLLTWAAWMVAALGPTDVGLPMWWGGMFLVG